MIELTSELKALRLELIKKSYRKIQVQSYKQLKSIVDDEIILTKEEKELCGIIQGSMGAGMLSSLRWPKDD